MKRSVVRAALAALLFLLALGAESQTKYALVIGNGAYTSITRLNNPVNDANDMKATLESLGFRVELILNGTYSQMEDGVVRLHQRLRSSPQSYGMFFYAGHGVQSGGANYLIPTDAVINTEAQLKQKALALQYVLDELEYAGNALNMIVLDACRDNPFG